jgi:hypothetical protein
MIIRSAESSRRELSFNPHAQAFARAHGLSLDGDGRRHSDILARMNSRARIRERQAVHDRLQASHVEFFESGRGIARSSSSPGLDDRAGEGSVVQSQIAVGRAAGPPWAVRGEPTRPAGSGIIPAADGCASDRSEADDERIAIHEAAHCCAGLSLFGPQSLGGATVVPSDQYSGRTWGPSNAVETGDVPRDLCERMRALMPTDGEPIADAAEIFAHVFGRCVDLLSGSAGEAMLCTDGPPWPAPSDLTQAQRLASIVCCSPSAIEHYLAYCRVEAANLVARHRTSIEAVAAALIEHRTLTGDQIVSVVAESVAREAMAAERQRRRDWRERTESACGFLLRR